MMWIISLALSGSFFAFIGGGTIGNIRSSASRAFSVGWGGKMQTKLAFVGGVEIIGGIGQLALAKERGL
jgi:hypothetical protein